MLSGNGEWEWKGWRLGARAGMAAYLGETGKPDLRFLGNWIRRVREGQVVGVGQRRTGLEKEFEFRACWGA